MVSNEDAPTTRSIQVVLPRILLSSSAMIDLGRMDRLADLAGKFAIFSALGRSWAPPQARRGGRPVVKMAELLMNSAIPSEGSTQTSWPALRNKRCTFDPVPRRFYSVLMPHQTEPNANKALAVVIRGMLLSYRVLPETT